MTPVVIITVLLGFISSVQGLKITSPKAGDKIDLQQGLPISWIVEDNDNLAANVTINLFNEYSFNQDLTQREHNGTVPVQDSGYTFQYTSDKEYIAESKNYFIRLHYYGSDNDYETGKFEIFNTREYVSSASISMPSKPTATQKGSKKSPSASASASVRLNSTSTRLPHHTPSASSGRANGLTYDSIAIGTMGLVLIGGPLLYGLILVFIAKRTASEEEDTAHEAKRIKTAVKLSPVIRRFLFPEKPAVLREPRHGPHFNELRRFLNNIQNHKQAWPFLHPVDKDEIPDYYKVIESPMDLSTIEERLERDKDAAPKDLVDDSKLIFSNCRRHNHATTVYAKCAAKLGKYMWSLIKEIPELFNLLEE